MGELILEVREKTNKKTMFSSSLFCLSSLLVCFATAFLVDNLSSTTRQRRVFTDVVVLKAVSVAPDTRTSQDASLFVVEQMGDAAERWFLLWRFGAYSDCVDATTLAPVLSGVGLESCLPVATPVARLSSPEFPRAFLSTVNTSTLSSFQKFWQWWPGVTASTLRGRDDTFGSGELLFYVDGETPELAASANETDSRVGIAVLDPRYVRRIGLPGVTRFDLHAQFPDGILASVSEMMGERHFNFNPTLSFGSDRVALPDDVFNIVFAQLGCSVADRALFTTELLATFATVQSTVVVACALETRNTGALLFGLAGVPSIAADEVLWERMSWRASASDQALLRVPVAGGKDRQFMVSLSNFASAPVAANASFLVRPVSVEVVPTDAIFFPVFDPVPILQPLDGTNRVLEVSALSKSRLVRIGSSRNAAGGIDIDIDGRPSLLFDCSRAMLCSHDDWLTTTADFS
jgi:hypothetical protein